MKAVARRRGGYTHDVEVEGGHRFVIDEPESSGGGDEGPSPTRAVAGALAACTAITCEMYAERKGWDLGAVEVEVEAHYDDEGRWVEATLTLRVDTELDDDQRERLLRIAGRCPVHRALTGELPISITDRLEVG